MKMLRRILAFLLIICYIKGQGQDSKCDCSGTCKPKITVVTGTGKGSKPYPKPTPPAPTCPPKGKDPVEVEDLPIWYCPNGRIPGAPCYYFVYPSVNVTQLTWAVADSFCKRLGSFTNLLWVLSAEELDMIRFWLIPQIDLPPGIGMTVWVGGKRVPTPGISGYMYMWLYLGRSIPLNNRYWAIGAPSDNLTCVGMDPYNDCFLSDYNCDTDTGGVMTYAGIVCKRQVVSPP